jgi:hypothetical protein
MKFSLLTASAAAYVQLRCSIPLVVSAVRTALKTARFFPSGSGLLDGECAAVVVVSVPCGRRKVTRVGIISSLAPSEWQRPTVRPVMSWSCFRPSWTNWAASLFRGRALPRASLVALSTNVPQCNAPSALSGRIGPAVSLDKTANGRRSV